MAGLGTNVEAVRKQKNKMEMERRPLKVESPAKNGHWGADVEKIARRYNAEEERAPLHLHRHFAKRQFRDEKEVDYLELSLYSHHQPYWAETQDHLPW